MLKLDIGDTEKDSNYEKLCQNYRDMNEAGKDKLKEISDKILEIWDIKNDKPVSNTHDKV
jgi:hypothetical protein